jgi:NAD(P)H-nitrite reductase large subunit
VNWKDAPVTRNVCRCKSVTKLDVIQAINQGARSLDGIREITGACADTHERNPACMNCHIDVAEMLKYYGEVADALRK